MCWSSIYNPVKIIGDCTAVVDIINTDIRSKRLTIIRRTNLIEYEDIIRRYYTEEEIVKLKDLTEGTPSGLGKEWDIFMIKENSINVINHLQKQEIFEIQDTDIILNDSVAYPLVQVILN